MPALPGFRSLARFLGRLALGTGLLLPLGILLPQTAFGQLPQIRLTAIHPTGGQRGTTVDITIVGGTDLEEADRLYFSHPGITAAAKTQMVNGKPQPLANQFHVTIAADVPVGVYDLRVHGRYGLSNPRTFSVGDRKEILEAEPNNAPEQATAVEINSVVNGRSDAAADVDWYKFPLKGGQRVIASFRSKRIDSRMDGVLELYQGGRRVSHQNVHGRVEPFLDFTAPADGEFQLKVHDLVYGGGADYFYRLALSTGPKIDFILPSSGLPNTSSEFTIYGRNLPGGQPAALKAADGRELEQLKLQIAPIADPATLVPGEQATAGESGGDGVPFTLASPTGSSNTATIYFASAPTALEQEPNDSPEKAQRIAVPVEVTGQFQSRGDIDVYQFDAKAGAVYWIEVFGERNDSAADPVLVIDQVTKNDKGAETLKRLAALDDNPANIGANQFNTTTDDPVFRFAAPAEGSYRVTVRDRAFENRGDPSLVYRLSIRHESPDFRLVVLPPFPSTDPNAALNTWDFGLRKGDNAYLTVMAFRRDGFAGPIEVTTEGLPRGVTARPATITAGQTTTHLVLNASEDAPEWFGAIRILGRAHLDNPAALAAENAAIKARTDTVGGLTALDKGVSDTAAALKKATDDATAAKAALDKDANNEALKKAKAGADEALAKAGAAAKGALDARAAAGAKVSDANSAVAAAREAREIAGRELTHEARSGTIVWSGNPAAQQSAQSRMARSITLSVLKETAPYQLLTDLAQVTVNQGSQILIPFKLLKRAGFDNNVTLTFVAPPKNVQVENKAIAKGTAEGLYRVFVQNNAAVGTYTLFAQSQSQVSYSRSPEAAAAAAKEKEAADKLAAEAAEAAKQAAAAKAAAEKNAAAAAEAAKKAPEAKAAAEKNAKDAATAAKSAADEKVKADKAAADAASAVKVAGEIVAQLKGVLEKDATNESLKGVKADADALAAKAAEAAKKVSDAKTAAEKKAADADAAAKKAADAIVAADKAIPELAAAAAKAAEQKVAAEKLAAEAEQKSKAAAAVKAAADKKAADTANVAKPQNVNAYFPAAAIVLEIKPAPGTLAVAAANGGAVKRGAALEVKVTINRANGFSGPVKLSLPLPPGIAGLSAPEVMIPADKNDGTLVVQTTAEATMGALANLVVRASMEFDGPAAIDQPLAITVQP